jgi:hypothetical protein
LRIDRTHRIWLIATTFLLLLATLAYVPYALWSMNRPSGSSLPGLAYGTVGYALMIFAALLSLRKRFPIWRIGRAQTWMRGHLWMGLASYPLILFHAAFSMGHGLSRALMWILWFVIGSGLLGAALQHYMPEMITDRVPWETIYNQIDRVQEQLLKESDDLLSSVAARKAEYGLLVPASRTTGSVGSSSMLIRLSDQSAGRLREVFEQTIRPYLEQRGAYRHRMARRSTSKAIFAQLRTVTPESVWPIIDDLENICEEKRDLDRQSRLQRILQGWLLVHIPLSYLLIVLGAIHAVMALRYT